MANIPIGEYFGDRRGLGGTLMELAGQGGYRQLAEEIGEVLQAAAETAEKMQADAQAEAARLRAQAEAELRIACAEGRRILDDARMEADMARAEAEWQAQEIVAQARREVAERMAGADARLAEAARAESRVLELLGGVGQMVAAAIADLREGATGGTVAGAVTPFEAYDPTLAAETGDDDDQPSGKVYFVEFPPAAAPAPAPAHPDPETEIVLTENPGASLFLSDEERSEWAPPVDMPIWWTRDGAQG